MLTLDKIFQASIALKPIIRETKLVRANGIAPQCELFLKPENLQNTGSFKLRGSGYKIAGLSEEEKKRGVVACSAGNNSQGVALAATKLGIPSYICMPDGAPISKVEATKSYGAEVCLVEGVYDDAYRKALQLRDEEGYTFIHPFDDEDVIAGQGTIALELAKQNLAGQIQTEVTALIENTVANEQMEAEQAASITRSVMASKNLISQSIGRVMPVIEVYRTLSNKNKEVLVRIAYNSDMAKKAAKKAIKEDLEKKGDELHNKLDELLGW